MGENMELISKVFLTITFAVALCIVIVAWFRVIKYSFKAIRAVRPGVNLWSAKMMFNPFNVLFKPGLLTDEGLKHRREVGRNALWFIGPILLLLVLEGLGRLLE